MVVGFQKVQIGAKQKVKVLLACMVAGQALKAGEVYELPAEDAIAITNMGKAEAVADEPADPVGEAAIELGAAVVEETIAEEKAVAAKGKRNGSR